MSYYSIGEKYDRFKCFISCRRNYANAEEMYLGKYPDDNLVDKASKDNYVF